MFILLIIMLILNIFLIVYCCIQIHYNIQLSKVNDLLLKKIKDYESFKEQDRRDKMIIRECLRSGGLL